MNVLPNIDPLHFGEFFPGAADLSQKPKTQNPNQEVS